MLLVDILVSFVSESLFLAGIFPSLPLFFTCPQGIGFVFLTFLEGAALHVYSRFGRPLTKTFFSKLYQLSWVLFTMFASPFFVLVDTMFVWIVRNRVLIQERIFFLLLCVWSESSRVPEARVFLLIRLFLRSGTVWMEPLLFKR